FFFSSRRRHTRLQGDWSSDVCSSDLNPAAADVRPLAPAMGEDVMSIGLARPTATPTAQTVGGIVHPEPYCQDHHHLLAARQQVEIGRASCRERVWNSVEA